MLARAKGLRVDAALQRIREIASLPVSTDLAPYIPRMAFALSTRRDEGLAIILIVIVFTDELDELYRIRCVKIFCNIFFSITILCFTMLTEFMWIRISLMSFIFYALYIIICIAWFFSSCRLSKNDNIHILCFWDPSIFQYDIFNQMLRKWNIYYKGNEWEPSVGFLHYNILLRWSEREYVIRA